MPNSTVFIRVLLISLLLSLPLIAQATVVEKMYEVSLPVINQERDIRRAAFEQAFIEVVVRVSGNSLASTQLDLKKAAAYVQQYRYLPLDEPVAQTEAQNALNLPLAKYTLWVQFNEGSIKKLLRENALPIWGQQRPNVLLWLAVRDGRNRYVLKQQDSSAIKDAVAEEARRRGLPIIWPKMDRQDRQQAGFADVWGSFWEPIKKASERYAVDAIMIGRMDWKNGSWQVDWSLLLDSKTDDWKLRAVDLQLLMASGVDVATDQISSRFAVLENLDNKGKLLVQVNGISGVSQYARASRYLASLALVKNVFATQVEADWVRFHVDMTGDRDDLKRIIALGRILKLDKTPLIVPGPGNGEQNPNLPPAVNILTYKLN
ncbi:MAG: DUF2066 domain-containing protein [Gammaproteobacteria bacterium]|nr:DUF2066 domain-containing protein [Gammaproteobacteria bacterium]